MHSLNDPAIAYLQQIQPSDLDDLRGYIHHDLWLIIGSLASYGELIDIQLSVTNLDAKTRERVADCAQYLKSALAHCQAILMEILGPEVHRQSYVLITAPNWVSDLNYDMRTWLGVIDSSAHIMGRLLGEGMQANQPAIQRIVHLLGAVRVTMLHMRSVIAASVAFVQSQREQEDL